MLQLLLILIFITKINCYCNYKSDLTNLDNELVFEFPKFYIKILTDPEPEQDVSSFYNSKNRNSFLTKQRSHKLNQDWSFSAPNWNVNTDQNLNILRFADPRSTISSHTHFIKVSKPAGEKKVFFTHNKKVFDHKIHPTTKIHKHTNVHIHNRNSNSEGEFLQNNIIGSHLFGTPRWRRNLSKIQRAKREAADLLKAITNPKNKVDVFKTVENVGAATKNLLEEEYSPMFHLRNALGSMRDSAFGLMKVRPDKIFIPCSYKIVNVNEQNLPVSPTVGAINPNIYKIHNRQTNDEEILPEEEKILDGNDDDDDKIQIDNHNLNEQNNFDYNNDALQQIALKLRESVQGLHQTATHFMDAVQDLRKVYHTAKSNWPKLLIPYTKVVELKPQNNEILGGIQDPEFIGAGKLIDSLGLTGRQIDYNTGSPRLLTEEESLLKKAKTVLGATEYQRFLNDMKSHLNLILKTYNPPPPLKLPNYQSRLALDRLRNSLIQQRARVQAAKIKDRLKLTKPAILQAKNPNKLEEIPITTTTTTTTTKPLTPLEKLRLKLNKKYDIKSEPADILGKTIAKVKNKENDDEIVGDSQANPVFTSEMKKPFMGLATKKDLDKYFKDLFCDCCKMKDIN